MVKQLLDRQPETPVFPVMQLGVLAAGITVTIHHSPTHSEQILLPAQNADAICTAWLSTRPHEVMKQVIEARRQTQAQGLMMNNAVKETMRHG